MARIFLSHSSANNAEAIALRDWLNTKGWDDLFLDIDPRGGVPSGERWERALNDALGEFGGHVGAVRRAAVSTSGSRLVTVGEGGIRLWDSSLGVTLRRDDLVKRICDRKQIAMAGFTPEDMSDPFVASLTGQDVCQRSGPLTGQYWLDLGRAATGWIKSVAPH